MGGGKALCRRTTRGGGGTRGIRAEPGIERTGESSSRDRFHFSRRPHDRNDRRRYWSTNRNARKNGYTKTLSAPGNDFYLRQKAGYRPFQTDGAHREQDAGNPRGSQSAQRDHAAFPYLDAHDPGDAAGHVRLAA